MLYKKKIFALLFIFIFSSSISLAENKIAYVDLDLILSKSKPSMLLFDQLEKLEKNKLEELKVTENKLKDEENKIISSKKIISQKEYNKNVKEFKKKINNYKNTKNEIIKNLKKKRNDEVLRFLKLINPLIEEVMNDNSIEILIEKKNIFIAKSNYDITQSIIDVINKNISEFVVDE
jgi:Skp family chaperone for outer membrane proteins